MPREDEWFLPLHPLLEMLRKLDRLPMMALTEEIEINGGVKMAPPSFDIFCDM